MASWKPKTGAVSTPESVAPSMPSTPAAAMMTVMTARTTKIISKIVNEERLARFFFFVSAMRLLLMGATPDPSPSPGA